LSATIATIVVDFTASTPASRMVMPRALGDELIE
jgi:hypothetical protein